MISIATDKVVAVVTFPGPTRAPRRLATPPKYSTLRCACARENEYRCDSSTAERDKRYNAQISARREPGTDEGSAGKNQRVWAAPPGRAPADGAAGQAPKYNPVRCVRGRERVPLHARARSLTQTAVVMRAHNAAMRAYKFNSAATRARARENEHRRDGAAAACAIARERERERETEHKTERSEHLCSMMYPPRFASLFYAPDSLLGG